MKSALFLFLALIVASPGAWAKDPAGTSVNYKGLWLSTPYPTRTVSAAAPVTLDLTLHNYDLPPQIVALHVASVPASWQADFLGDGRPVSAVAVAPDGTADLKLQIVPPQGVQHGSYSFVLRADGQDGHADLPVTLDVGDVLPPRLGLTAELPDLRGSASSTFSYKLTIANESGQDALVNLKASTPPNFQVSFKQAYGSKELTTVPVKAGGTQDIDVDVSPPGDVTAGTYPVEIAAIAGPAQATAALKLEVTGRAQLTLAGPDGLISGEADAGKPTPVRFAIANTGSAPAQRVTLTASAPTGWTVEFQPKSFDAIPPDGKVEATATITPSAKAIAGDYMVTLRGSGGGASASSPFRITVETSTMWGVVGIAIIAIALAVLGMAVVRYGRR